MSKRVRAPWWRSVANQRLSVAHTIATLMDDYVDKVLAHMAFPQAQ